MIPVSIRTIMSVKKKKQKKTKRKSEKIICPFSHRFKQTNLPTFSEQNNSIQIAYHSIHLMISFVV
uniref:Uncharacterized protein n=1 Tax=Rhizophora mucronata TaxID=61149 RepID=A0A2P2P1K1_RHIMU